MTLLTCRIRRELALPWFAAICVLCGLSAASVSAGDFEIVITVCAGQQKFHSERTHEAPSSERPIRQVVELQRNQPVQVAWLARNTSKSRQLKDVLVHFFIVKENKLGQAQLPKLTEDVAYEGALTMDFEPRDTAKWSFVFKLREPGSYLLRVETIGTLKDLGHEHHASLELAVK